MSEILRAADVAAVGIVVHPAAVLDAAALGRLFGLKPSAARKLIARERAILRPSRIGRAYYVRGADVLALMDARRDSA